MFLFRRFVFHSRPHRLHTRHFFWGTAASVSLAFALRPSLIRLDAPTEEESDSVQDADTGIHFPKTIRVASKVSLPTLSLLGVGVRTVSFLGIKVYSVGFYADLHNPNLRLEPNMTSDEKIRTIVDTCACEIRIVPTRNTSYTHLRDAWMRAMTSRLSDGRKKGTLSEDQALEISSPIRKLKTLFPNSPLAKHCPLDIFLLPPIPGKPRPLIFRDLGAVESDWVGREFVLHYFDGDGVSPPLKKMINSGWVAILRSEFDNAGVQVPHPPVFSFKHSSLHPYALVAEQVDFFLDNGYLVIPNAFTKEKAEKLTKTMWIRLGLDPNDKSTWSKERIHMPFHRREAVATFAPKAWDAMQDLLGGADRIDEAKSRWGDSFIVNLGTDVLETIEPIHPRYLDNWHVDGDFFVHYLDSPEQALLVIPIFSNIKPGGGGTFIAPEGIGLISRYLASHPEGVMPTGLSFTPSTTTCAPDEYKTDPGYWSHLKEVQSCTRFIELTGKVGDVVLLHPLMLHSASKNYIREPRVITNPPVALKKPFEFFRENENDYSLVERKTLKALGLSRLDFSPTTERYGKKMIPKRIGIQEKILAEEKERLREHGYLEV
ncbi:hypothetical protein D9757_006214 [Collybiopsis confluens]|uniref:Chalcone isomerase domain-containing protein n=1 Tax=Collybiopsis confluens TaxID=2823264 RepID=A0A8H5HK88_9AGAR|nr:hypothetical protein D9757_006214 [Collybiopsis confluens]